MCTDNRQAQQATKTHKRAGHAVAALLLAAAVPALAHHSAAMFEEQVTLTLTGTVTHFDYVNPHSWLYVNVESEDGTVTEWGLELDAPPRLRRIGVSPNHWREGDRVTVRTRPLKDGRPAGLLVGAASDNGNTFGNAAGLTVAE
jgi:hypothetical protein